MKPDKTTCKKKLVIGKMQAATKMFLTKHPKKIFSFLIL